MVDLIRLRQTLGQPELAWLVTRLRRRFEQGRRATGTVTLRNPTPAQRAAVDALLGRRPSRAGALTVRLDQLQEILRHGEIANDLATAIAALDGPLVDLKARRSDLAARWSELYADLGQRLADSPAALGWLAELRARGLLRRYCRADLAAARVLTDQALDLISRFPVPGVPLAELAAQVAGDSHGLDPGRPLGTLGVRAAAAIGGLESWTGSEARRDAWASVGVLCDELSAPVLVLNLRSGDNGLTARALRLHADGGEPYRLTSRQLLRHPPQFHPAVTGSTVFVCENPTVVAAAANRLGIACAPMVCIDGQPRTPSRLLLTRLTAAGITLAYHGDFDWAGIGIANLVMARHQAQPWRMSTSDYLAAGGGTVLRHLPVAATWDPDLEPAMLRRSRTIHEEQVLEDLLTDLAEHGPP